MGRKQAGKGTGFFCGSECNNMTAQDGAILSGMAKKRSADPNVTAHDVLDELLRRHDGEKNPAAVALGRLGGLKGGKARAAKLSAARRSEIARQAVAAREAKRKKR